MGLVRRNRRKKAPIAQVRALAAGLSGQPEVSFKGWKRERLEDYIVQLKAARKYDK